ncbi:hypothetical protein [uncultured Subdoligranulum sp.]|uniref:hypothetical protein n=1 Tax=uncultured Subdoligranulum sp. TaxID=512298 RepID=UPI0025FEA047|nr:hypothetical protein [uncultured Subdoligranulum sp.]
MELIDKRNSITYDAEKDELKIVTYYNEDGYKNICLRTVNIQYNRHCFLSKDPAVRRTFQHREMVRLRRRMLFYTVPLTLYCLIVLPYALEHPSTLKLLGFCLPPLIIMWAAWLFYPSLLAHVVLVKSGKSKTSKEVQPLWSRITHAFSEQAIFQQEVVVHPDGYTWNTPDPDNPTHCANRVGQNARVLFDYTDLYLFQFGGDRDEYANDLQQCLHFVERNYSVAEWDLLMHKLHDMKYI